MKSMIADFKQSMRKLRTKPGKVFVGSEAQKQGLALGKVWEKYTTEFTKSTNWIKLSGTLSKTMAFFHFSICCACRCSTRWQDIKGMKSRLLLSRLSNVQLLLSWRHVALHMRNHHAKATTSFCKTVGNKSIEPIKVKVIDLIKALAACHLKVRVQQSQVLVKGDKQKMTKGTVKCQSPVRPTFFLRPVNILNLQISTGVLQPRPVFSAFVANAWSSHTAWHSLDHNDLNAESKFVGKFHAFALQAASSSW